MSNEIPEWVLKLRIKAIQNDLLLQSTYRKNINNDDSSLRRSDFIAGFNKAYQELSKPENQAKFKETKALIEAAKNIDIDCETFNLEQALKPFESGE